ncbi:MAG: class I SAM-dependent methyltransferase [Planctomycetota bacterium]|jgi:predicted SAM-dependent methyltransferase
MCKQHSIDAAHVLDVGSLDRKYRHGARICFPNADKYVGIDIRHGPNVDIIMDIYDIENEFEPATFDVVLCLHVLEHLPKPWEAVDQMSYALKDDGYLFVSMPTYTKLTYYPRHDQPGDFWRATHEAITDVLMTDYEIISTEEDASVISKHPFINCLGRKNGQAV